MPGNDTKTPGRRDGFVIDGAERLADGVRVSIQKEVEAEFSGQMERANWFGRLTLRRQMRKEIEQRIAKQMPSEETLW